MGKASGVSRRRKKKFNYNINRKKLHKKALALPKLRCKQIKEAWDSKKSYLKNMEDMGLSANPNKTITTAAPMEIDDVPEKAQRSNRRKKKVADELEAEASEPQPKTLRLPNETVKFCVYMMEKYDEDYKAMSRDPKNYYQETPKQIKKRIKKFKNIPEQWNGYLRAKGLLTADAEVDEYCVNIDEIMGS